MMGRAANECIGHDAGKNARNPGSGDEVQVSRGNGLRGGLDLPRGRGERAVAYGRGGYRRELRVGQSEADYGAVWLLKAGIVRRLRGGT